MTISRIKAATAAIAMATLLAACTDRNAPTDSPTGGSSAPSSSGAPPSSAGGSGSAPSSR